MPRPPIHPGEHLRIDLEELGMSQAALARALHVPRNRISQIISGERGITADTALRLAPLDGDNAGVLAQSAGDVRLAGGGARSR